MGHFAAPASGKNIDADYLVDNKMAPGSVGRMIVPPNGSADIVLCCADTLAVRSNNPNVISNPIPERWGDGGRILTIKPIAITGGAYIDFGVLNTDGWSWAPGSPWPGHLLVNVEPRARAVAAQAGKAVFASMDQCGIAALDEILSRSISEGVEFAGLIFKQGARFGFTSPLRGEPTSALPMPIPSKGGSPAEIQAAIQQAIKAAKLLVPAGTDPVGSYHTHGNVQGGAAEGFSIPDRGFHNLRHWFAYLGTPSGAILRFTPKDRAANENVALAAFGGKQEKLR